MPVIIGPLLSISAKGHFSDQMTFFRHSNRNYLMPKRSSRGLFVSKNAGFGRMPFGAYFFGYGGHINPKNLSIAQNERRALFSASWDAYARLSPEQKIELAEQAKFLNMTGANLFTSRFIKENMNT